MRKRFGIITPTISPFKSGSVDHEAVAKLVGFAKKNGIAGLFPAGSTGCAPILDKEQHIQIIRAFASENSGMMLFAGVGRNSIGETVETAKAAVKAGCDAIVVVTPYYLRLGREEIIRYYDSVLDLVDHDAIAYNIPQLTGNAIDAKMFNMLSKRHRNLIGIKDSSKDMPGFKELCRALPEEMLVFQGEDDLLLQSLRAGASGGVCGTTNFDNGAVRLMEAYSRGSKSTAESEQRRLVRIMKRLVRFTFPRAYQYLFFKEVMGREALEMVEPFGKEVERGLATLSL